MKTRALDKQGLKVSAIGYGAMRFAGPYGKTDTAAMMATVQHAVDLPITVFDTAQKQAWIADALGYKGMAADAIAALIADLGMPTPLRDVGVREDQLDQIATKSPKAQCKIIGCRPIRCRSIRRPNCAPFWTPLIRT